jgi:hypothetical protein
MLIGYARTSTVDQQAGFEAQLVELNTYGVNARTKSKCLLSLLVTNLKQLLICFVKATNWL